MADPKDANPILDLAKEALYRFDPDSVRAEVVGEGMYRIRHAENDLIVAVRGKHCAAGIVRDATQLATVIVQITDALQKASNEEPKP